MDFLLARWPAAQSAAARPMFELFNTIFSKFFTPSLYFSINVTLYPMRHRTAIRQYNPAKPYRYELLIKSLNNSFFPYIYKATTYAGKPVNGDVILMLQIIM